MKKIILAVLVVVILLSSFSLAETDDTAVRVNAVNGVMRVIEGILPEGIDMDSEYSPMSDTVCIKFVYTTISASIWNALDSDTRLQFSDQCSGLKTGIYEGLQTTGEGLLEGINTLILFETSDGGELYLYLNNDDVSWMIR